MNTPWKLLPLIALLPGLALAQEPPAPATTPAAASVFPERMGPAEAVPADPANGGPAIGGAAPGEAAAPGVDTAAPPLQQLVNHRWKLTAATDAQAQPLNALFPAGGRPYFVSFSADGVSVQGPCNTLAGTFSVNADGRLEIPPLRATLTACDQLFMAADTALSALLAQPLQMTFPAGATTQLQLQTPGKDTLLFEGALTPEALYGPGTIIFLEIDAQRLACRNPRNADTTCLQARELAFDEQGVRIPPPGPWKPFYDPIDGYTHVPGERNVLRVKRFERGKVPGFAAHYRYVLDMVVETEQAPQ